MQRICIDTFKKKHYHIVLIYIIIIERREKIVPEYIYVSYIDFNDMLVETK